MCSFSNSNQQTEQSLKSAGTVGMTVGAHSTQPMEQADCKCVQMCTNDDSATVRCFVNDEALNADIVLSSKTHRKSAKLGTLPRPTGHGKVAALGFAH